MYFIIYASSATTKYSKEELIALLKKSHKNNQDLGITGMLLYKDGSFLQVLEGEKSVVRTLFDKITHDNRHKGIFVYLEGNSEERQFSDWSMGFRDLDSKEVYDIPGYSEFLNYSFTGEEFKSNPSNCKKILLLFKKNVRE